MVRNIRLTLDTYGHLDVADLREAMEEFGRRPACSPTASRRASPLLRVQVWSKARKTPKMQSPAPWRFLRRAGLLYLERNTGFEPATFALARRTDRVTSRPRFSSTITNRAKSFGHGST